MNSVGITIRDLIHSESRGEGVELYEYKSLLRTVDSKLCKKPTEMGVYMLNIFVWGFLTMCVYFVYYVWYFFSLQS